MRLRVAALAPIRLKSIRFDTAVFIPLVPLAKIVVAKAIRPGLIGEEGDDAVLRLAFGSGLFRRDVSG